MSPTSAGTGAEALLAAARASLPALTERLRLLVTLETPTSDARASARIADLLTRRYVELGAAVTPHVVSGGTHLVADLAGSGSLAAEAPVVLLGHSDTVWPAGTLAEVPWSVEDDVVRGPGSLDMKAGLVIIEAALELTATAPERRPVRVVVCCDEEIGSPSIGSVLDEAVVGAGCVLGFEAPHPDGALKRGRWGSTRLRLEIHGRAAHAALDPEKGVSATDELVDQLLAVRRLVSDHDDGHSVLLNVGSVDGGRRANVVADRAGALIGLRFRTPAVERAVLDEIAGLVPLRSGAEIETTVLSRRPAWSGDDAADRALAATLGALGTRLGTEVGARSARGAADTNQTGSLGVPTIDGLGPVGAGAHARDEHASLSSLAERAALVAAFLIREESLR